MNCFYVYVHRRLSDNSVFYIGKGKGKRAWNRNSRNNYWHSTVNKHGYTVDIVFDGLNEQDAFRIEKDTILEHRYFGAKLCNMTDGGEGASGHKVSEETRKLLSDLHKGRVKSPETCEKLRAANIGRKVKPETLEKMRQVSTGKLHSQETRKKMSDTHKKLRVQADNNTYVFFNKDDVFIGTRSELAEKCNMHSRKLRTLFQKNPHSSAHGWSVLRYADILILKEIIK